MAHATRNDRRPHRRLHGCGVSAWTGGLAAALAATTGAQALATLAVFVLPVLAPAAAPDLGVPARWVGYQVDGLAAQALAA